MKIFLDTNVLISALTTRGLCSELLEMIFVEHELLVGEVVLEELRRVLPLKFSMPSAVIRGFEKVLRHRGQVLGPGSFRGTELIDPDDLPILACAIGGQAAVFVTGDRELLQLKAQAGMPIVSPRDLWLHLAPKF